jgi:hypothetical protein
MNEDHNLLNLLGEKTILDENGETVPLSSLWKEQRAVLVFVRHFG